MAVPKFTDLEVWEELRLSLITEEADSVSLSLCCSLPLLSSSDSLWAEGSLFLFGSSSSHRPWHWSRGKETEMEDRKTGIRVQHSDQENDALLVSGRYQPASVNNGGSIFWGVPWGWICGRREPVTGPDRSGRNRLSSPHRWCSEGDTVYSYLSCSGWKGRSQTGRSTWWR